MFGFDTAVWSEPDPRPRILVTGATGYVGGRLLHALEARGARLRAMARRPDYLRDRASLSTEVVEGDVFRPASLLSAMEGVHTVYYLVHALGAEENFEEREAEAARNVAWAARIAGVKRIIYLGGLGHGEDLSPHLASRQKVGHLLRESGVPTIEFRAGIILGSGSLSFEMIRTLVRKLPVMIVPRWTATPTQPIAVEDVIAYLLEALERHPAGSEIYEIGGADVVSYRGLMNEYARQKGLRRWMLPVPVLSPRISSLWLALVTPLYARVGRRLVDGLRNETVVRNDSAHRVFDVRPMGHRQAFERAFANEDRDVAETRWSDAVSSLGGRSGYGGARYGSRIVDSRSLDVALPPKRAFAPVRRIGGERGYYYGDWMWRVRGGLDRLLGGAGLRRGRRDPERPRVGEPLDFWRVEAFDDPRLLRLCAEMKMPGRAWLQFDVEPLEDGSSRIRQTAIFDPRGLSGLLYWYLLWPAHAFVFRGMLRGIARAARLEADASQGEHLRRAG